MPFYLWSETPNNNGTADPTINMAEGMAPSAINDGIRAAMARVREYGNDIAGAIVTSGTSTSYTVSSNQVFDTLAHLNGQVIAFSPHATNTGTTTLSVDGLTAKPLRSAPSVELLAGTIIQGTPYVAIYNNTDGAFYLQGFFGNSPSSIPVGGTVIWWTSGLPSSSWTWCNGGAINRTVYAQLFGQLGTTFGVGDGSTTFNVPDLREVAPIGVAGMGATGGRGLTSFPNWNVVGTVFGEQNHTLTAGEIPTITATGSGSASVTSTVGNVVQGGVQGINATPGSSVNGLNNTGAGSSAINSTGSASVSTSSNNTGGAAHNNMQPSVTCGYIIRVI
jgi:microcystin-dependent protein